MKPSLSALIFPAGKWIISYASVTEHRTLAQLTTKPTA